jgi:two-component system, response regulator PdtaR
MSALNPCVLVVEDEYLIAEGLCLQLEDIGLTVCGVAATVENAVAMAETHRPFIVLMDVRLRGDGDGVDAALAIHEKVGSKVIFVTGSREPATLSRIQQDHPAGILFKPLFGRQLQTAVEQALAC